MYDEFAYKLRLFVLLFVAFVDFRSFSWKRLVLVLPRRFDAIPFDAIFRGVPKNVYFYMIIMRYLYDFHCYVILCEYIVDNPFECDFNMLHLHDFDCLVMRFLYDFDMLVT